MHVQHWRQMVKSQCSLCHLTWFPHRKVGSCSLLVPTPAGVAGKGGLPHFFYDYRLWSNLDSPSFHRDRQWSFIIFTSSWEPHAHTRTQLPVSAVRLEKQRPEGQELWEECEKIRAAYRQLLERGRSAKKLWDSVGQCCRQCVMNTNSLTLVKDVTMRSFKQGFAGELKQKRKRSGGYLWASAPMDIAKVWCWVSMDEWSRDWQFKDQRCLMGMSLWKLSQNK